MVHDRSATQPPFCLWLDPIALCLDPRGVHIGFQQARIRADGFGNHRAAGQTHETRRASWPPAEDFVRVLRRQLHQTQGEVFFDLIGLHCGWQGYLAILAKHTDQTLIDQPANGSGVLQVLAVRAKVDEAVKDAKGRTCVHGRPKRMAGLCGLDSHRGELFRPDLTQNDDVRVRPQGGLHGHLERIIGALPCRDLGLDSAKKLQLLRVFGGVDADLFLLVEIHRIQAALQRGRLARRHLPGEDIHAVGLEAHILQVNRLLLRIAKRINVRIGILADIFEAHHQRAALI